MFNTQCPAYINLIPIIFHTKLPTTQRNKNMKFHINPLKYGIYSSNMFE